MSLKRNILASYVGQTYSTLIAIAMMPMYLSYMGAEAYGLVGFYVMLQAWFQLLDMGLSPTMARETARYQEGGGNNALNLNRLLRSLEIIFIAFAVLGGAGLALSADFIATRWLKIEQLPLIEVERAIILMSAIISLRWVCGLYRGAINGFERMAWLSGLNIFGSTARFVLVIPLFYYVGTSPTEFFSYQLVIAIIETVALMHKTYQLMPKVEKTGLIGWQWEPLRKVLKFSLSIAFTSSVWILVTQTDKLILSNLLTLKEYAYFTLAVLAASGVSIVSGPVSGALVPRLTKLWAAGDEAGFIRLYRKATQFVAVIAISVMMMLSFYAEPIIWVWTGNVLVSQHVAPVLSLYAMGNGILALAAFPYFLQYAKGELRLHVIGNVLFVVLLIPAVVWATQRFGILGAGYAWLIANIAYFICWVPVVHAKLLKGVHLSWLLHDIAPPLFFSLIGIGLLKLLFVLPIERVGAGIFLMLAGAFLLFIGGIASSSIRETVRSGLNARKGKYE